MAGEVDHVAAFAFLQDVVQRLAGHAILEHANIDGDAALLSESLQQAVELVTLAAEVEGGLAIGKAENGEHAEALADRKKILAPRIAIDLKDHDSRGERPEKLREA